MKINFKYTTVLMACFCLIVIKAGCQNEVDQSLESVVKSEVELDFSITAEEIRLANIYELEDDFDIEGVSQLEEEEVFELEVINLSFGETFRYDYFEIEVRDEILFVFYEEIDREYEHLYVPARQHFYIPVVLRNINPEQHGFEFADRERWDAESRLNFNTVIYDPESNSRDQFHNSLNSWREPGRDYFSTIVGITHLAWLDDHNTMAGAYTYIQGLYNGDGQYTLKFYYEGHRFRDEDDILQFEATRAFSIPIDITWPETYTTITTEHVTRDAGETFQVGNFQVTVESNYRWDETLLGSGRTVHYFPITVTNISNVDAHVSSLEPITFAQNGSNPIRQIYFEGEAINMPSLLPLSPSMWMRFEVPLFASTCGQLRPYRVLQLTEMIEEPNNSHITVRHHTLQLCVNVGGNHCE